MVNSIEDLDTDPTNFEPGKAERMCEMMRRDFPVDLVRKMEGVYENLLNYYV